MDSDHVLIDFTLVAARLGFLAGERTNTTIITTIIITTIFTLVAARLGFLAGERTGPTADSASDHSSVEIEIVGFLDRYICYI